MIRLHNLALLSLVSTAPAQHWLSAPVNLPTGIEELRLSGDLDLDGDIDFLAIFNGGNIGYLTPWTNNGSGRFAKGVRTELPGSTATRVALADVTGDGRLDFISAATRGSDFGSGLLVYPGLPGVRFGDPVHTPLPGNITGIAVGDADGSGPADLAVLHFTASFGVDLAWFVAAGNGKFDRLPGTPVTGLVDDILCVDLDDNDRDDVALSQEDSVRLYLGQSAPGLLASFQVPASLGGFPSAYLDAGDLDGDGDPDLAVGSHGFSSTALNVVRNRGGGTWTMEPGSSWTDGQTFQPLIGDWDDDGLADIVAWTFQPDLRFFRNQGDAKFEAARRVFEVDEGWITHASLADLDGDGLLDLHLPRQVLFGDGTFDDPHGGARRPTMMLDWERDGDQDLMTTTGEVMLNDGTGSFTSRQLEQPEAPAGFFYQPDMFVADLDLDGDMEFLAYLFEDRPYPPFPPVFREMHLFETTPSGQLVDAGLAAPVGVQIHRSLLRSIDIDRDGDTDVLNRDGIFLNTNGFFTGPHRAYPGWVPVQSGDVDGDGDLDLLATRTFGSQNVGLLRQGPPLVFTAEDLVTSASNVIFNNIPLLADLDDDGDLDVAANPEPSAQNIVLFENRGGGFHLATNTGLGRGDRRFLAADVDHDGSTDLVVPGTSTQVYRRVGPGLVYENGASFQARAGGPQRAADIDNDGDPDLMLGTIIRNRVFFGPEAGGSRQYGSGTAGAGGHVPVLGARGVFRPGESAAITVRKGLGGSLGVLAVGLTEIDDPTVLPGVHFYAGGQILHLLFPMQGSLGDAGAGTFDFVLDPLLHLLQGHTLYHQAAILDPATPQLFSFTNGLEIRYGR